MKTSDDLLGFHYLILRKDRTDDPDGVVYSTHPIPVLTLGENAWDRFMSREGMETFLRLLIPRWMTERAREGPGWRELPWRGLPCSVVFSEEDILKMKNILNKPMFVNRGPREGYD